MFSNSLPCLNKSYQGLHAWMEIACVAVDEGEKLLGERKDMQICCQETCSLSLVSVTRKYLKISDFQASMQKRITLTVTAVNLLGSFHTLPSCLFPSSFPIWNSPIPLFPEFCFTIATLATSVLKHTHTHWHRHLIFTTFFPSSPSVF